MYMYECKYNVVKMCIAAVFFSLVGWNVKWFVVQHTPTPN